MPANLHRILAPALAGHAFQQTALVGMLPVLADRLHLAVALPVVSLRTGRNPLLLSLLGLLVSSLALVALLAAPVASGFGWALPALIAIRTVQGVSAGALLIALQQASVAASRPLGGLARAHSLAGIGRLLGALSLGPLLLVSAVAPLLPAALGALLSLARGVRLPRWQRPRERAVAPVRRVLVIPVIVQGATGAAQIGLAPLLADRLAVGPEAASGYAGLCLAAANLGLLATHCWVTAGLTPAAMPAVRRLCPLAMAAAALALPLCDGAPAFAALSAVVGGASALLLATNLSEAMAARPEASGQTSGWNSGAEVFLDLLSREPAPTEIVWLCRREAFWHLQEGGLVDQIFTPAYQRAYRAMPEKARARALAAQKYSSDGLTPETADAIYAALYRRRHLDDRRDVSLRPWRNVTRIGRRAHGFRLTARTGWDAMEELDADFVLLATGYRPSVPDCLAPLAARLDREADGSLRLGENYRVLWDGPGETPIYALNHGRRSYGVIDPQLSMAAWRSAVILNDLVGWKAFDLAPMARAGLLDWGESRSPAEGVPWLHAFG
jgi:L-lysine 6-monooxygenase (NADPH-requiring)